MSDDENTETKTERLLVLANQTKGQRGEEGSEEMVNLRQVVLGELKSEAKEREQEVFDDVDWPEDDEWQTIRNDITTIIEDLELDEPMELMSADEAERYQQQVQQAGIRISRYQLTIHNWATKANIRSDELSSWLHGKVTDILPNANAVANFINDALSKSRRHKRKINDLLEYTENVLRTVSKILPGVRDIAQRRFQEDREVQSMSTNPKYQKGEEVV